MLKLTIPAYEVYNEETQEFTQFKAVSIKLEHSLISLSKWESKWHKPFLTDRKKTYEEVNDYIKQMCLDSNVPDNAFSFITPKQYDMIDAYISDPMSATTINNSGEGSNKEILTSELIYYYMIANNIPFECQKWHLNRLMKLINVCGIKNNPGKKQNPKDILRRNAALNAERKKAMNTRG